MISKSIQNLLDWLDVKGLLKNRNHAEAYLLCDQNAPYVPLYIHVLMGFGAFMGCSFISSLLFAMNVLSTQNYSYLITGLIFIILALVCYYPFRYARALLHSFSTQSALIFMLIGKIFFVVGSFYAFQDTQSIDNLWVITISLFIITLATYFIFPNIVDRFISCLATLLSLLFNLLNEFNNNIPLFIIFILSLAILYGLYIWRDRPKAWDPLVIVSVIFICFMSIFLSSYFLSYVPLQDPFWKVPLLAFNLILAVFLIALCFHFSGKLSTFFELPILFACVSIIILSLISNNGVMWSIGLLMLGYGKHHRGLITFGIIFLILFLIEYYYSLQLTLQYKSFLLIGSGVFLLMIRSIMKYLNWEKD